MDVGQCNDAYSAIQIALALANAFDVDVNQLPLSMILSWYEQKAVSILLTLYLPRYSKHPPRANNACLYLAQCV